jgi:hypothetical protein
MITESEQRTIRRESDVIIAFCRATLDICIRLDARCLPEDHPQVGRIADNLRTAMIEAGILREINDKRKVAECQHGK